MVSTVACACAFGAGEPFENLMPEGTFFFVGVRSVPELIEKVKNAPGYKLFSEPEMQPFMDQLREAFEEPKAELARATGTDPEELRRALGGQACIGMLPPQGDEKANVLLLADVTGDPDLAETALSGLIDHLRQERADEVTIKEETYRGHTIYHLEPVIEEEPEEEPADDWDDESEDDWGDDWAMDEPDNGPPNPGFLTLSGGILAIAVGPERMLLEKHLVLREGGDLPSLDDAEGYRQLASYLGEEPDLVLYGDLQAFTEDMSVFGPGGLGTGGAGQVGPFGYGVTMQEDGVAGQGFLAARAPRQGLLKATVPQAGSVMPPGYVDEEVAAFGGVHFSIPVFYAELMAMLEREAPQQHMAAQQWFELQTIDIENDIIKAFGSRAFIYMPAGAGESAEPSIAVALDLSNSGAFSNAWGQLLASMPPFFQYDTVDFMGVTVYQFRPAMGMGMEGEELQTPQPCIAIMEDKLLYASDLETAKSVIRNDQRDVSPLLGQEEFQRLLSRTMEDPDGILFLDGRIIGRWIAEAFEEQRMAAEDLMGEFEPPPGMEGMTPELTMPDMPPWKLMEKYQTPTLLTTKWTDEGLLMKSWAPHAALEE
jgi:hypothetical protein